MAIVENVSSTTDVQPNLSTARGVKLADSLHLAEAYLRDEEERLGFGSEDGNRVNDLRKKIRKLQKEMVGQNPSFLVRIRALLI